MFGCGIQGVCGLGSLGADNAPVGDAARAYYVAGTPFLWLAPATGVRAPLGVGGISMLFMDLARDARNKLAATLASAGYDVRVVADSASRLTGQGWIGGSSDGVLEVSGSQRIDRASALHIRDQITQAAENAGFNILRAVQFNVEAAGSPFRVGMPGSVRQWGDTAPVVPRNIFTELGVDLTGDTSFVGGSIKNLMLYAGVGLLAFAVISRKR